MSRHQRFWSFTRATFCKVLASRFRHTLEEGSDPEPEPPFIVVSNHGNFFDPWIVGHYQEIALHIMMNDDGFRSGAMSRWYLNAIGAFPKKKGAADLKAMKNTLSFLRSKEPVIIFPEGQATWDGETQPIYGGIERMVKRAKCSLVVFRLTGGFLTKPWWSHSSRKGRINVKRTVYSPEELAKMDPPEILQVIQDGIYNNDILATENQTAPFSGKDLALGTTRLLWVCAHCKQTDTLSAKGDQLSCSSCGGSWRVDAHCRLHPETGFEDTPENLHAWHQHDKALARQKVSDASGDDLLCENDGVSLRQENDEGRFEDTAVGTLSLTSTTLRFRPVDGGDALKWEVADLSNFVIQKKDVFEVTHGGKDVRFDLTGFSPMKWVTHVRYLRGWEEIEKSRVI